jgi:UDP-glucose 4-epimerase
VKLEGSRVLVTGGAGFIGSHLVDYLIHMSCQVVVLDDLSSGSMERLEHHQGTDQLSVIHGSVLDPIKVGDACRGVDFVFHLATRNVRSSLRQPTQVHEVNVEGTYMVLKAATAAGVRRLLYCSSSEVNGTAVECPLREDYHFRPETIYGASKLCGEFYSSVFHRSGWLDVVIARPHNTYGPRQHWRGHHGEVIPRFILWSLAGRPCVIYGDGKQTRDFTFVTETASYIARLADCPDASGGIYNVCRGEEVSIGEIALKIRAATASRIDPVMLPGRPSDVMRLWGDNQRLRNLLGDAPAIGIDEGLERTCDWFRRHVPLDEAISALRSENWEELAAEKWLPMPPVTAARPGS